MLPLHHVEVPSFASSWPTEVAQLVEGGLGDEVPPEALCGIVLSVTPDRQRLGVWLQQSWENTPTIEGTEGAAGFISLAPWLDQFDAIARGALTLPLVEHALGFEPVCFDTWEKTRSAHASFAALHRALVATAVKAATEHLAPRFTQPVGVFVSLNSGGEAQLVAFCHPRGAPLWPVRERRKEYGYSSAYAQASFTDDAMTVFYPEGEGVDGGGPAALRERLRSDLTGTRVEDDEVHFTFSGEDDEVTFAVGHTSEENGGPDGRAVLARLRRFAAAPPSPERAPSTALDRTHEQPARVQHAEVVFMPSTEAPAFALEAAVRRGDGWVALQADQLVALEVGQPPRPLWTGVARALAVVRGGLLLTTDRSVLLLEDDGRVKTSLEVPEGLRSVVAVSGALAAVVSGTSVRLLHLDEPMRWGARFELREDEYVSSAHFIAPTQLLLNTGEETVVLECADAATPTVRARLATPVTVLSASAEGVLAFGAGRAMWLDPTSLAARWSHRVHYTATFASGPHGEPGFVSDGSISWLTAAATLDAVRALGPDGYPIADVLDSRVEGARALVVHKSQGLVVLDAVSLDVPSLRAEVDALTPAVNAFVQRTVETWCTAGLRFADESEQALFPMSPVSWAGVAGSWMPHVVRLLARAPMSVVGSTYSVRADHLLQPQKRASVTATSPLETQRQTLINGERERWHARLRQERLSAMLLEAGRAWAPRSQVREVVLALHGDPTTVLAVLPGGGDLGPVRPPELTRG